MRAAALALLAPSLLACSAAIRRPLVATEAAADLEQLTRSSDNEIDPAVSPDGKSLAYSIAASPGSPERVAVAPVSDPGRPLYVSSDVFGREPAWMPDGSGIVFVARPGAGGAEKLVQTFGQNEHRPVFLADVGDPNFVALHPAVSPTGKLVAMAMADVTVRAPEWPTTRRFDRGIGLTDLLGSGIDVVSSGTDPAFSPDGAHLAFVRWSGGHEHLFIADADGKNAAQITEGPADDQQPAWSPDGRDLVFCSAHGDEDWTQSNLFVVHADGSGLVQLTEGDRVACHPSWSRDGRVYFHANEGQGDRFHIWRFRITR